MNEEFDKFERSLPSFVMMKGTAGNFVGSYLATGEYGVEGMKSVLVNFNQQLPDWVFTAPIDFMRNILQSYFRECAFVNKNKDIKCFFANKTLADGFLKLLAIFEIYGTLVRINDNHYQMFVKWHRIFENEFLEEVDEFT
jgi:hypothetical protein